MTLNRLPLLRSARLVGILFQDKLSFNEHVTSMLKAGSQHSYRMKLLRDQGLPQNLVYNVFQSHNLQNTILFTCLGLLCRCLIQEAN